MINFFKSPKETRARAIDNLEAVKLDLRNTQDLAKKMGLTPMTSTQARSEESQLTPLPKSVFPDFLQKVVLIIKN